VTIDTVLERIGKRIVKLRRNVGLTQEALAERVGMDVRDFQRIEVGKRNVTVRTLVAISNALRVDPEALWRKPKKRR
jgi:transcriptional regulator with XRE-family HTH domain